MASSSSSSRKSKAASSSTFLDLKAELARKKEEFASKRAAGGSRTTVGGAKKPDKKPSIWARPNKGVASRSARDVELEAISKPTLENARAQLERKAAIYEKLRKGKTGGLSDKQFDSLLVDFDQPRGGDDFESDSEDEDESLTVPRPGETGDDDPLVEYEDEFGRMRTVRKSEVPRHLANKESDDVPEEKEVDPYAIYGDQGHFPVYEQDPDRIREIEEAYAEATKDPTQHYDASRENRTTGAGFYQFSGDEETRKKQMAELKSKREETERARREAGVAEDEESDEEPGPQPAGAGEGSGDPFAKIEATAPPKITGRGIDKRKRELEERRRAIEAKRRKLHPGAAPEPTPAPSPSTKPLSSNTSQPAASSSKAKLKKPTETDNFLQGLEADLRGQSSSSR